MDILFGIKLLEAPTAAQKLALWLIKSGCRLLGFVFEARDGNTN